jgi:hypothetical protein
MVLFRITGGELKPEIEMPASATILALKERINEVLNMEVARQTLSFGSMLMENDRIIDSYGFPQFVVLSLIVRPLSGQRKINILVKSSSKVERIRMRETQKVAELREKISRRWGISVKKMTLLRLSKEMDDNLLLSAYYISRDSEVEVKVHTQPR